MLQATVHGALNSAGTSTATMAQQGSVLLHLVLTKQIQNLGLLNSGASDHMAGDITTFDKYSLYNDGATVWIADGSFSVVAGIGSVIISRDIRLDSILFVLIWIITFYPLVRLPRISIALLNSLKMCVIFRF